MRRLVFAFLLAGMVAVGPASAAHTPDEALVSRLYRAVALLYKQDASGSLQMMCTATAFDTFHGGYRFVTAAHCIGNDDVNKERAASAENQSFYITFDEKTPKLFHSVTVRGVGYQHRGDDFAILDVRTELKWQTIPLGDETKIDVGDGMSAGILNVASPNGLGKQIFHGYISSVDLDRPVVQDDINWKGALLLQIQVGPGSSGSAIVSEAQEAIVGFLVGTVGGSNTIAVPVSKFKVFKKSVESVDHPYRWYVPDAQ